MSAYIRLFATVKGARVEPQIKYCGTPEINCCCAVLQRNAVRQLFVGIDVAVAVVGVRN